MLTIGREYTISTIGKFNFAGDSGYLGDVPVVSLIDSKWGGYYPLSLFQPLSIKEEENYENLLIFNLRKIWVGDDDKLRERVVNKLKEYNITMSSSACCKGAFSCLFIPGPNSVFGTYDQKLYQGAI